MSTGRARALSTRISETLYAALCERAQTEGFTVCALVAQLLGDAVGEGEMAPAEPSPDPEPPARPDPVQDTIPGEEMLTRREAEVYRWQLEMDYWRRDTEARQARLEQSLAARDRRLAEALNRLQAH